MRELAKAYVGFSGCDSASWVATGNWGCGVFGGHLQLKAMIQWLAGSMAGKNVRYCPFGSKKHMHD